MNESEIRTLYGWAEIDPAASVVAGISRHMAYHLPRRSLRCG